MLRITVERSKRAATFKVDGTLTEPWVQELERVWRAEAAHRKRMYFQVDLSEVVSVDRAGKELLAQMYKEGVDLIPVAIETRAIVDEIARGCRKRKRK